MFNGHCITMDSAPPTVLWRRTDLFGYSACSGRNMNKKLTRIGYVIDDLGFGGAQRQLSIVCNALEGLVDPYVYCLSEIVDPFKKELADSNISVTTFRRRGSVDLARLNALARRLSEDGIDIVHGILDASNIYASIAARRTGLPCVLSLRTQQLTIHGFRKWLLSRFLRRAIRVVVNSGAGAGYLEDQIHVHPERIVLLPNAITPRQIRPRQDETVPTIGFVGRLTPHKGVDQLILAFKKFCSNIPEARLIIAGDGTERSSLETLCKSEGIADRVQFFGNVNDVDSLLLGLTCLVLPSTSEGLPNVLMEALANGIPVVAAPAGDVADLVTDGETGYLMREQTPDELATLIERVCNNKQLQRMVQEKGPAEIERRYPVATTINILMDTYNTALNKQARQR